MRILLVEDELIPANYLKKILEDVGYEVIDIVTTGTEAISRASALKPDIILMDIMLKDHISGCDAALEIKHRDPHVMIIFLTAYSDKEMIEFAIDSKAFGYLLKPYREKEIIATLKLAESHQKQEGKNDIPKKSGTIVELVDNFSFDTKHRTLYRNDTEHYCGPRALQLIAYLCERKHHTIDIDELTQYLWGEKGSQQALRSLIHRIRKNTSENLIKNVNKIGYKIGLKRE